MNYQVAPEEAQDANAVAQGAGEANANRRDQEARVAAAEAQRRARELGQRRHHEHRNEHHRHQHPMQRRMTVMQRGAPRRDWRDVLEFEGDRPQNRDRLAADRLVYGAVGRAIEQRTRYMSRDAIIGMVLASGSFQEFLSRLGVDLDGIGVHILVEILRRREE